MPTIRTLLLVVVLSPSAACGATTAATTPAPTPRPTPAQAQSSPPPPAVTATPMPAQTQSPALRPGLERLVSTDDLWIVTHPSANASDDRTPEPEHLCGDGARARARSELAAFDDLVPIECARFPCWVSADAEVSARLDTRADGTLTAISFRGAPLSRAAERTAERWINRKLATSASTPCARVGASGAP